MKRQTGKCSCQIRFKLVIGDKLSLHNSLVTSAATAINPTLAAGRIGLPDPLYPSAFRLPSQASHAATGSSITGLDWLRKSANTARPAEKTEEGDAPTGRIMGPAGVPDSSRPQLGGSCASICNNARRLHQNTAWLLHIDTACWLGYFRRYGFNFRTARIACINQMLLTELYKHKIQTP